MSHILAITIGPIFDTLQQARKTRELWAASYLYSHLMELLMTEIKAIGGIVILPQKISDPSKPRYGAGVYNDRMYASINEANVSKVDDAIKAAIGKLAAAVASKGAVADEDFWQKYLRIEWAHKPLDSLAEGALFKQMEPLLNASELHRPYFWDAPKEDRLTELLDKVYETKMAQSALKSDEAKGKYNGMMKGLFPSTADLATFELFQRKQTDYRSLLDEVNAYDELNEAQTESFYEKIFAKGSPFEGIATDYHKYFCIVHADGDNLGLLNSTLTDEASYQALSTKLSGFALEAAGIINDYGGKPVYIGGDDLLFFAPVCSVKEGKTVSVFQMISKLDEAYAKLDLPDSALSFGITLSYHKFPLLEARQLSYEQLAYYAKKTKWTKGGEKNAIAFRLLKHSGAYFEGILSKSVLKAFVDSEVYIRQGDKDLISGIVFKMETLSGLFDLLVADKQLEARIPHLFDNFFNEPIHQRNEPQMKLVRSLLLTVYQSEYEIENKSGGHTRNFYAILRLLKFVTDKPERKREPNTLAALATTSTIS